MTDRFCILSCRYFTKEIGAIISTEEWDDVTTCAFSSCCGRPPITWDDLRILLSEDIEQLVVLGSVCLKNLCQPPADFPPTHIVHMELCFHLVADRHLVEDIISIGGYLVTPGWLADWRGQLQKMGFGREQAAVFFQEFANKLVLLDTGIDPQSTLHLGELGKAVNLSTRQIAVGLDHPQRLLSNLVLQWRLERERLAAREQQRRLVSELADHVAAMDVLTRLTRTQHEDEAIAVINELFHMLFAPAALYYLKVVHNLPVPPASIPAEMFAALCELRDDYAWTADGQGLLLRISHGNDLLGLIVVDRFTFPEYRERYLNMAISVIGICGLAIDNARNHNLLEAQAALKDSLAEKDVLLREVHHRVKNNMAAIIGLFNLHRQAMDDPQSQTVLSELSSRVRAMSLVHEKLYRSKSLAKIDFQDYIQSLISHLRTSFGSPAIKCDIQASGVEMPLDLAVPCGMIINELVINALKYAFPKKEPNPGSDGDRIEVAMSHDNDTFVLSIADNGVGLPAGFDLNTAKSLGLALVRMLGQHQLGGRYEINQMNGTRFTLTFSLRKGSALSRSAPL